MIMAFGVQVLNKLVSGPAGLMIVFQVGYYSTWYGKGAGIRGWL